MGRRSNYGLIGPKSSVAGFFSMSDVQQLVQAGLFGGVGGGGAGGSATPLSIFTTSGQWKCPEGVTSIELLVVAGGGGGLINFGGGGGAGGAVSNLTYSVTPGNTLSLIHI